MTGAFSKLREWLAVAGDWRSTGGVINITAAAWTAGFHWWRSGNIKRTQNVSEYMVILALCLVTFSCNTTKNIREILRSHWIVSGALLTKQLHWLITRLLCQFWTRQIGSNRTNPQDSEKSDRTQSDPTRELTQPTFMSERPSPPLIRQLHSVYCSPHFFRPGVDPGCRMGLGTHRGSRRFRFTRPPVLYNTNRPTTEYRRSSETEPPTASMGSKAHPTARVNARSKKVG